MKRVQAQSEPIQWLNQQDSAAYIGISARHLRHLVATGVVPAHRLRGGRSIRFKRADLDALLRPIPTVGNLGGDAA
jgi:excisionase family DNA binding protein